MKYEVTSYNTKKMLADSLKKLMKNKVFSKITVSEIIQACGVNRKTFYYHFEDIYALLKWIFENEAVETVKHFDLATEYEQAMHFVMDYIEKNDYIINCAYDSIGRNELKRFFYKDFSEVIYGVMAIAEKETGKKFDIEYRRFLCNFYTEAMAGVLIDWMKNREQRNREQVVEYISSTLKGSMMGILERDGISI